MENAGFKWYYSLLVSLTVYTGAYQFVLVTLLSSGASILTMALTAFLMNSRQSFYALTFVDEFNRMGKRKLYMIHTMTDETYAVNCTLPDTGKEKQGIIFIDQWEKAESHIPAIAGFVIASVCLLVVGPQYFLLPSLIIASAVLVVWNTRLTIRNSQ